MIDDSKLYKSVQIGEKKNRVEKKNGRNECEESMGRGMERESRAVDSIHARGGRRGYKVRRDKHRRINYA